MSILLDALKKSEEQRRIGQAPDIHSAGVEPPAGAGGAPRWIPVAMIAAAVVLMTGIGWLQLRAPANLQSSAGPQVAAQEESSAAERAPAAVASPAAKPRSRAPAAAVPNRTPVEAYSGTNRTPPEASTKTAGTNTNDSRTRVNESFREFRAEPESGAEQQASASAPSRASTATPQAEPAAAREMASKSPSQSGPAPDALEPISYWQLPQSVRDDMPELKITVLVFADRPEDRFLLVNGQRLSEKDEIPGGVVLDEIRRDGAVFQYRKYRFLVKG